MNIESVRNTYVNAIYLRRYLLSQYLKAKINTRELIEGIKLCDILIITNFITMYNYGMDKSGQRKVS